MKNIQFIQRGGGSLIVLNDGTFVCHRRDKFAPIHKLYHSASSGFVNTREAIYTEKGLLDNALRETAEETLLITRDENPRLVVSSSLKNYSIKSMKKLGLNLPIHEVSEELLTPKDTLIVCDYSGSEIFRTRAILDIMYDTATSLNALQVRMLDISSEEVLPLDAEGRVNDGNFEHFNRESFMIPPNIIEDLPFGTPLDKITAYQTRFEGGKPVVYESQPSEFLGPGASPVTHPFLWAPENLLSTCLHALGVKGYEGKFDKELWKDAVLSDPENDESSLIPEEYLVNR